MAFLSAVGVMIASAASAQTADIVFSNGKVYTMNEAQPRAEAVAVKGNKIVFVGSAAEAEAYKGADLIVLENNLFEIDQHDIHKTRVLMTMMDGVVGHHERL